MTRSGKSVVVIGAGGNIGSHLVPHLGRLAEVGRVTLVDPGRYEEKDLAGQHLRASDIGRRKVSVQARRLRRIRATLSVQSHPVLVEHLPLGALQSDLLLACLDSRRSRQYVNRAAWRLGVPWIDAGVDAGGLLARIDLYAPGPEAACLECGWSDRDYELLEQVYPCDGRSFETPATEAPSSLGALAASLQALEAKRLLVEGVDDESAGLEVVIDARHHRLLRTRLRRNSECRMKHRVWSLEELAGRCDDRALDDLFALDREATQLRVEGRLFVRRLVCADCGRSRRRNRFEPTELPPRRPCTACGGSLVAAGFDVSEWLEASTLHPRTRSRSLVSLGIRVGDVVTLRSSGLEKHLLITGDRT